MRKLRKIIKGKWLKRETIMTEKKPKWAQKWQISKKANKEGKKRLLRPASGWELGLQWGAGVQGTGHG